MIGHAGLEMGFAWVAIAIVSRRPSSSRPVAGESGVKLGRPPTRFGDLRASEIGLPHGIGKNCRKHYPDHVVPIARPQQGLREPPKTARVPPSFRVSKALRATILDRDRPRAVARHSRFAWGRKGTCPPSMRPSDGGVENAGVPPVRNQSRNAIFGHPHVAMNFGHFLNALAKTIFQESSVLSVSNARKFNRRFAPVTRHQDRVSIRRRGPVHVACAERA